MEFNGSQSIAVSRDAVWRALNDPAVLQACVPGCESFTEKGPNEYHVLVVAAIGPVKAKFKGNLQLSDLVADTSYRIVGGGDGGVAGFGKMTADVLLADDGEGTLLTYAAKAEIGGKLAQIGSRLVGSVANKMADEFFKRFKTKVTEGAAQA
jgi:carbon monoxide dehydrogenase subunit G